MTLTLSELLEKNSADPRVRLEVGQSLIKLLNEQTLPTDCTVLADYCDVMVQWMAGSNFKVALLALESLEAAVDRSGDIIAPHLLDNLGAVMERLGDTKEPVRQQAHDLILKAMTMPHSSPQAVLDRLAGGFTHKQWLVRIGALQTLRQTLSTFGSTHLQLSKFAPLVAQLVADPNGQVRDAASDTLVDIYIHTGDKFAQDLQRRRLVPDSKLATILARFRDAKDAGLVSADGQPLADVTNSPTPPPRPHIPPKPSRESMNSRPSTASSAAVRSFMRDAAGAVTEDSFYSAFEDVARIEVYSGRDLVVQVDQIRAVLSDANAEWNKRIECLKRLRSLVVAGAPGFDEFWTELKLLEVPFQLAAKDLRSQVVREACITLAYLSEKVGLRLEHLVEMVFHVLVTLIQNSAKVMSSSGFVACRFIIKNVHTPKLIPIVTGFVNSKSREIRRACQEFVVQMLQSWQIHALDRHVTAIKEAIRQGLGDADVEARTGARKTYAQFAEMFPQHAEQLFSSLEPTRQRMLGDVPQSTSTHSFGASARHSQENLSHRPSNSFGYHRQFSGARSRSDVDPGAARTAAMRHQYSAVKARPPQPPPDAASNLNSLPSRPRRLLTGGVAATPRLTSARSNGRDSVDTRPTARTPKTPVKSTSQPGSRSNSPTSRSTARKPRLSSISGRSQSSSREQSPSRLSSSRRYSSGATSPASIYDALKLRGARGGFLDDFETSDTSSVGSDRSLNRFETAELSEALRCCASTQWTERKEGLASLQLLFRSHKRLSSAEIKRVCDVFTRMFVDPHNKTFILLLDTIVEFLGSHRSELAEWLYILLTRLLSKMGSDLLASVQSKVQRTLDIVRDSFPYEQQFTTLIHYIQDPLQTPSIRVKAATLNYFCDVIHVTDSAAFSNTAEARQAMSKIIHWTGDPKSAEVRRAAQSVLMALFSLNASEFSTMLCTFPKQYQDAVYSLLHNQTRKPPLGDALNRSARSSASPGRPMGALSLDMGLVHDRLRETSAQIQHCFAGDADQRGKGSQDSGIVDAADAFHRADDWTNGRLLDSFSLSADEERQQAVIGQILTELSNHNCRVAERCLAMTRLKQITRDGSFTLWDEHFKTILLILLETLGDCDAEARCLALRTLKEICLCQAWRFRDYAELTLLKVLEAHRDSCRDVSRAAEDVDVVFATHLPPSVCLRVLVPVIRNEPPPTLLAAIKMVTKLLEQLSDEEVDAVLIDLAPGIVQTYDHQDSSVRKASVLCLVALHNAAGEDKLQPFLSALNNSKLKLLHLYIKRGQSASGHI